MQRQIINPREVNPKEIYEIESARNFIVIGQLTLSYRTFKLVDIIKNIDKFEELVNKFHKLTKEERFENLKENEYLFYRFLDAIKISIAFENYFKAKLILNDFIIHKIKNIDFLKEISKTQRKRPIEKNELIDLIGDENKIKEVILDSTIDYSTILNNESYFRYLNLDNVVIKFLIQLNKDRNRLHLLYSEPITISRMELNNFKKLNEVVDFDITVLQRFLLEKLDPESKSKIPINF